MKKSAIIISLLLFAITGCFKEESELLQDFDTGAVFPEITNVSSSFFDSFDFDNAYVEFTVDVPSPVKSITIERTFGTHVKELGTYTSFPVTVKITAAEAVEGIPGMTVNDLVVGDEFSFQILVTSLNDMRTRSNVLLNATVACKSSLAGTYNVLASGQSTDPGVGPGESPISNYPYQVTLTETGTNGVYTISEFSGGLYPLWYDIYGVSGDVPGTLQDVCNTISYLNTFDPWGAQASGGGSVDPATGVITITGGVPAWGDTWTLVLTPVK